MNVYFNKTFKKAYAKRIEPNKNLEERFEERYDLFIQNPSNSVLKDHPLGGRLKGYRAFSVTGDIRVVYRIFGNMAYFVDVGTHNQVYGD